MSKPQWEFVGLSQWWYRLPRAAKPLATITVSRYGYLPRVIAPSGDSFELWPMDFEAAKEWAEENLFEKTMNRLLMLSTAEISAFKAHSANTNHAQVAQREFISSGASRARKHRALQRIGQGWPDQQTCEIISQIPKEWQRLPAPTKRDLLAWQRGEIVLNHRRIGRLKKSMAVNTEQQLRQKVSELAQLVEA